MLCSFLLGGQQFMGGIVPWEVQSRQNKLGWEVDVNQLNVGPQPGNLKDNLDITTKYYCKFLNMYQTTARSLITVFWMNFLCLWGPKLSLWIKKKMFCNFNVSSSITWIYVGWIDVPQWSTTKKPAFSGLWAVKDCVSGAGWGCVFCGLCVSVTVVL